jgi:hypothetical protein
MAVRIPRRRGCGDVLVGEHALGGGDRVDAVGFPVPPIAASRPLDL